MKFNMMVENPDDYFDQKNSYTFIMWDDAKHFQSDLLLYDREMEQIAELMNIDPKSKSPFSFIITPDRKFFSNKKPIKVKKSIHFAYGNYHDVLIEIIENKFDMDLSSVGEARSLGIAGRIITTAKLTFISLWADESTVNDKAIEKIKKTTSPPVRYSKTIEYEYAAKNANVKHYSKGETIKAVYKKGITHYKKHDKENTNMIDAVRTRMFGPNVYESKYKKLALEILGEDYGGPAPITQYGSMGAQSGDGGNGGGAFGNYPIDTGAPAQGPGEQPGYGGGPTDDARMPTGLYAINTTTGKKKKFTKRDALEDFLKKNKEWKKGK